jgi:hypothetical protein
LWAVGVLVFGVGAALFAWVVARGSWTFQGGSGWSIHNHAMEMPGDAENFLGVNSHARFVAGMGSSDALVYSERINEWRQSGCQ